MQRGVIQGGILSPKLFNIFYDTLIEKIDKLKIFMIAYADDIVIAQTSKIAIRKALKIINEWADEYEMKFNKNKSTLVFHTHYKEWEQ